MNHLRSILMCLLLGWQSSVLLAQACPQGAGYLIAVDIRSGHDGQPLEDGVRVVIADSMGTHMRDADKLLPQGWQAYQDLHKFWHNTRLKREGLPENRPWSQPIPFAGDHYILTMDLPGDTLPIGWDFIAVTGDDDGAYHPEWIPLKRAMVYRLCGAEKATEYPQRMLREDQSAFSPLRISLDTIAAPQPERHFLVRNKTEWKQLKNALDPVRDSLILQAMEASQLEATSPGSGYFDQGMAVAILLLPYNPEWKYLNEVGVYVKGDTTLYGLGGTYESMALSLEWLEAPPQPWQQSRIPSNQVIVYPVPAPKTPYTRIIGASVISLD